MGKHKNPSSSSSTQPPSEGVQSDHNPHAGPNWGIMHVLKYHVKKKLPHRKHGSSKHDTGNPGDSREASEVEDLPPKPTQNVEASSSSKHGKGKRRNPGPVLKDSVKYILKGMKEERSKGKEEKSKGKGKHRRSRTCPEQPRTNETHSEAPRHGSTSKASAKTDDEETIKTPDEPEPHMEEVKSEDNSDHEPLLEDKGKQLLDDEVGDHEGEVRLTAKLLKQDVFASQAKEIMDALDIISMNKEFLLRVMQDPGSPLAQHFQKQQAASAKMALRRSESFPLPGSHDAMLRGPGRLKSLQNYAGNHSQKYTTISPSEPKDLSKNFDHSVPDGKQKVGDQNEAVIKRFKDLRHKIKHVVKENKAEERRITMDAVWDKMPTDKDVSNDFMRKEATRGLMYSKRENLSLPFSRNKTMQNFERSPSLKESMDRYLQLYESSFQKEANQQTPERQISRNEDSSSMIGAKRSLIRISSSPELGCYLHHTDRADSSDLFSPEREVNAENSAVAAECSGSTSDGPSETEQEPEPINDQDESNQSNVPLSQEVDLDAKPNSVHLEAIDHDYSATMQAELEKAELLSKDLLLQQISSSSSSSDHLPPEVVTLIDEKDEASFNYVKDVLHLAGFSGNEALLEKYWHSNEQPLDPSMVDHLEGCMLHDPNCPGNEKYGYCSHLIMFDLINEVLLEIYEGTYSYSPVLFSRFSKFRPKNPVGTHVVEEVWMHISWYLSFRTGKKSRELDYVVSRDLMRRKDGWMNLQFNMECVGLELEELIFDGLLKELVLD